MSEYRMDLALDDGTHVDAWVDERNRWRLGDIPGFGKEQVRALADVIRLMVLTEREANPRLYYSSRDAQYAIDALRVFPNSRILTPLPIQGQNPDVDY